MTSGTRKFAVPGGLIISAMLDHDDEQRPALTIIGWFADRTKVEVTYSWGGETHHNGLPVEVWCEVMLHLLTPELASEIVQSGLMEAAPVIVTRRERP